MAHASATSRHKFTDNVWDVAPALVGTIAFYSWAEWKFADIAHHHRD